MILCTVTMTSNRSALIGDALRSVVDHADICLLLDLGITDDTIEIARSIVGDRLRVAVVPNGNHPRNFGLEEAERLGADWACTLDTDERMNWNGHDIKHILGELGQGTVLVQHDSLTYSKERFFKLPALDKFIGWVHECVPPVNTPQIFLQGITFSEIPKTPEQLLAKGDDCVNGLTKSTQEDPDNPRWWYYLGDSLVMVKRFEEAVTAFQRCADLRGWDEESAWACYRCATVLAQLGRPFDAIECCAKGLARHPGIAELAWLAGAISLSIGMPDKSVYWGRLAVANGTSDGENHFIRPRIGFRNPYGATVGPYELMAQAYDRLGKAEEANACREILTNLQKEATNA